MGEEGWASVRGHAAARGTVPPPPLPHTRVGRGKKTGVGNVSDCHCKERSAHCSPPPRGREREWTVLCGCGGGAARCAPVTPSLPTCIGVARPPGRLHTARAPRRRHAHPRRRPSVNGRSRGCGGGGGGGARAAPSGGPAAPAARQWTPAAGREAGIKLGAEARGGTRRLGNRSSQHPSPSRPPTLPSRPSSPPPAPPPGTALLGYRRPPLVLPVFTTGLPLVCATPNSPATLSLTVSWHPLPPWICSALPTL